MRTGLNMPEDTHAMRDARVRGHACKRWGHVRVHQDVRAEGVACARWAYALRGYARRRRCGVPRVHPWGASISLPNRKSWQKISVRIRFHLLQDFWNSKVLSKRF